MTSSPIDYPLQLTDDGSYTFFSSRFNESYHSSSGARDEARKKFVKSCKIPELARKGEINILDICYGLGYNTAAAMESILEVNPGCRVRLWGLEDDREVPLEAVKRGLHADWMEPVPEYLKALALEGKIERGNIGAGLLIGDARETIEQVRRAGFRADAIFLDPFSPTKCPQLWTVEFINLVAGCLKPTGYLATYSCAASVRTALKLAGLNIGATESVGRRSPGTIASFLTDLPPLSLRELEHLRTRAAVPYRDPSLKDTGEVILKRRLEEQANSPLEASSRWKKRWLSGGDNTATENDLAVVENRRLAGGDTELGFIED